MSGMFLSVAVENAEFMLERGIRQLARGPLARHADIHQICTFFRQRGVASLLLEGTADTYHVCAMQSASAYAMELRRIPDTDKVTAWSRPLQDAVGSGYWSAAEEIARSSRTTWNSDYEYEDDFSYVRFWHHLLLGGTDDEIEATLERYEEVLAGAPDVRLDICRALHARDEEAFDEALRALLDERRDKVNEMIGSDAISKEAAQWIQHFALEGVALLALAEKHGLSTGREYLHCPDVVRGGSPFQYDPNAWMRVDFVPRRV